ncbi:hypothetical protein H5410_064967 [Solanum commersonii]|uniref:Uncharacterized protein n=1 Tax=Solanum commersonii TaxID=4109 RepID=A0A9J5VXV3_SOLCO|nr:hypothetical protein H5410_064967 [Solanum commersonii]
MSSDHPGEIKVSGEPLSLSSEHLNRVIHDLFSSYSPPVWATLIAGVFIVISLTLSMYLLFEHLSSYKNPEEQMFLIGVILMVPCYAVESVSSFAQSRRIIALLHYKEFFGKFENEDGSQRIGIRLQLMLIASFSSRIPLNSFYRANRSFACVSLACSVQDAFEYSSANHLNTVASVKTEKQTRRSQLNLDGGFIRIEKLDQMDEDTDAYHRFYGMVRRIKMRKYECERMQKIRRSVLTWEILEQEMDEFLLENYSR